MKSLSKSVALLHNDFYRSWKPTTNLDCLNVRLHTLHGLLYGPVQPAGQCQSDDFHAILVPVPVPLFVFGFVYLDTASVLTIQFQYSEQGIKQTASVFRAEVFYCPGSFADCATSSMMSRIFSFCSSVN